MASSRGTLCYGLYNGLFNVKVANIEDAISAYARRLIPTDLDVRQPKYPPHITVIRNEEPRQTAMWGLDHGALVEFDYDSVVRDNGVYFWLPVYSKFLHELRQKLGLPRSSEWSRPPDGAEMFHITVGNRKHLLGNRRYFP